MLGDDDEVWCASNSGCIRSHTAAGLADPDEPARLRYLQRTMVQHVDLPPCTARQLRSLSTVSCFLLFFKYKVDYNDTGSLTTLQAPFNFILLSHFFFSFQIDFEPGAHRYRILRPYYDIPFDDTADPTI